MCLSTKQTSISYAKQFHGFRAIAARLYEPQHLGSRRQNVDTQVEALDRSQDLEFVIVRRDFSTFVLERIEALQVVDYLWNYLLPAARSKLKR